jgi:phasin family protein
MSSTMFAQATPATQANMNGFFDLASKAFSGWTRLIDLNFRALGTTLDTAHETTSRLLDARDPAAWFNVQASLAQPASDAVKAYYRDAFEIISGTQTDVASAILPMVRRGRDEAEHTVDTALSEAAAARDASLSTWQSVAQAPDAARNAIQEATDQLASAAEQGLEAQADAVNATLIAGTTAFTREK